MSRRAAPRPDRRTPVDDAAAADLDRIARDRLGLPELHPLQRRAANAVAGGRDVLVVAPTGFGKSAIYELAGLVRPGPTVVVSPLIALQADQLRSLDERSLGAVQLNSTLGRGAVDEAWAALDRGEVEFVLLAPEQLAKSDVRDRLATCRPSLVVIDEAHCVSEWGHDFRPDYLLLGAAIDALGHPPTLALTATAGPSTRADVIDHLRLRDPEVIVAGMDRPNIRLEVRQVTDASDKPLAVAELAVASAPAIVYVATRRTAEELAAGLRDREVDAAAYHAGLRAAERADVQERFMRGDLPVVVATTAFGMGIDKPDVRLVVHADPPGSVEQYYQELGRAGRDGAPAAAVLLFRPDDLGVHRFFAAKGRVPGEVLDEVARAIDEVAGERVDRAVLAEHLDVSEHRLVAALGRLEAAGEVRLEAGGDVVRSLDRGEGIEGGDGDEGDATSSSGSPTADASSAAVEAEEAHARRQRSRVELIRRYAEATTCRRRLLLGLLGDEIEPCGNCDARGADSSDTEAACPWPIGSEVEHTSFGAGVVAACERDTVTVLFAAEGYRTLDVALVIEQGLLRPVAAAS